MTEAEIIEDVAETAWHRAKTRHRGTLRGMIVFAIVWYAAVGSFAYESTSSAVHLMLNAPRTFTLILIFPAVVIWIWYGNIREKAADDFMRQFAVANDYIYKARGSTKELEGSLFHIGHTKEMEDVVSGYYLGHPLRLFTYHYSVGGSGKPGQSKRTYNHMVFELTFDTHLPRILVRSRKQKFTFDHPHEVRLEGNFSDHFEFGVDEQYEIEALQVFTPDFMAYLLDLPRPLSIELIGNKLFLYADSVITKRHELHYFYEVARHLIERLGPLVPRLKDDVLAMDKVFKK